MALCRGRGALAVARLALSRLRGSPSPGVALGVFVFSLSPPFLYL